MSLGIGNIEAQTENILFNETFDWLIPWAEEEVTRNDYWRFASYNTHSCSPAESTVANYDNTAAVISSMDPDVIAIQEVVYYKNNYDADQMSELSKRTGLKYTYLPLLFTQSAITPGGYRTYGIAMMYKYEPLNVYTYDKLPGNEARGFIAAEFEDYIFISTHLDNGGTDEDIEYRRQCWETINQYVEENYGSDTKPIYLGGDLNAINLPAVASEKWTVLSPNEVTVPTKNYRLDYILIWKGNDPQYTKYDAAVPTESDGLDFYTVSDHLPVYADIIRSGSSAVVVNPSDKKNIKTIVTPGATGSVYDAMKIDDSEPGVLNLSELSRNGVTAAQEMENHGYTLLCVVHPGGGRVEQPAGQNIYLQKEEERDESVEDPEAADAYKTVGAYLKFGKSHYQAGLQFPALKNCGTGSVKNVKATFDWCPVMQSKTNGGKLDATKLILIVNDDDEHQFAVPAHTLSNGHIEWIPTEVDFGDYALKNGDRITVRNDDDGWTKATAQRYYLRNFKLTTTDDVATGVEELEMDENSPVEYYTLEGIRVSEPATGLYIVRKGGKVTKRFIRK